MIDSFAIQIQNFGCFTSFNIRTKTPYEFFNFAIAQFAIFTSISEQIYTFVLVLLLYYWR